ncbi:MAG: PD40 domain-containing protein [Armatimonadota bacterium]|nr:MAG: PD40 domain-containing protein [Armatimonadota bacterium]
MSRKDIIASAAAAAAALLATAGIIVTGARMPAAEAQHAAQRAMAQSAYMYVDFADDFQDPRQVALGWSGSGDGWRATRRPGDDGFMRAEGTSGASTGLLAAAGRAFLARNFTMYVDVRRSDLAAEAGLAWGSDGKVGWRATVRGNELLLVRADPGGEMAIARVPLPESSENLRLGVVSGLGSFSVTLGDGYVAQAPWERGDNPGRFGLWARGSAEFDDFALEARPLDPGTVAVAKTDLADNLNIYIGPADGGIGRFVTARSGNSYFPTWSPEGTRLAFQTDEDEGTTGLWMTSENGDDAHEVIAGPYFHPDWSPDGRSIAFDSTSSAAPNTGEGSQRDVFVAAPDGSGISNITNHPSDDFDPTWSPDGRRIAFCSDRDGSLDIFVANADGSEAVNITNSPGVPESDPAWSPDGAQIAFVAADGKGGRRELFVVGALGGESARIAGNPVADANAPAWSPDGGKIAFTEERSGDYDVVIVGADGSNPFRAFGTDTPEATAAWRPPAPEPEPQVAAASVWGYPGRTVAVPILARGIRGLRAATIDVAWDGEGAALARVAPGEVAQDEGWSFDTDIGAGSATIELKSGVGDAWRTSGALAELEFEIPAAARHGAEVAVTIRKVALDIAGIDTPRPRAWDGGIQVLIADHFAFAPVAERQIGGALPRRFEIALRALDEKGDICAAFVGPVRLESVAGRVESAETGSFVAGQWTGAVAVSGAADETSVLATHAESGATGHSGGFHLIPAGSVTGDDVVDATDLERAADIAVGALTPTEWQALAADVNGDGAVTAADVAAIGRIVRGGGGTKPNPGGGLQVSLRATRTNRQTVEATVTCQGAGGIAAAQVVLAHRSGVPAVTVHPGDLLGYGWKLRAKDAKDQTSLLAYAERGAGPAREGGVLAVVEFSGGQPQDIALRRVEAADAAGKVLPVAVEKTGD